MIPVLGFLTYSRFDLADRLLASILIFNVAKPSLDRTALQESLAKKFARFKISNVYSNETMIISYAYNQ